MTSNPFRSVLNEARALFTNRFLYVGIGILLLAGFGLFVVFNYVLMPSYTRHDAAVAVPRVVNLSYEQAARLLQEHGLRVEQETQRYDPDAPRDAVVDQTPSAETFVKPGRRVYLTVNTGQTPTVTVPRLEGFSAREAANQLRAAGLRMGEVRADSIPHPYQNTVTRQTPPPGSTVREGEAVTIWLSTGPGEEWVTVPDVSGMVVQEARNLLLNEYKLRSRVLGAPTDASPEEVEQMEVTRQSNAGARVRQGHEVRLHVDELEPEDEETDPDLF